MKGKPSKKVRRGSMLVALLLAATFMLHAGLEVLPLWTRTVESARLAERRYRKARIDLALRSFRSRRSEGPRRLEELLDRSLGGPYLPRVYEDPCRVDGDWQIERDDGGRILTVSPLPPSPTLVRPRLRQEEAQKTRVH